MSKLYEDPLLTVHSVDSEGFFHLYSYIWANETIAHISHNCKNFDKGNLVVRADSDWTCFKCDERASQRLIDVGLFLDVE